AAPIALDIGLTRADTATKGRLGIEARIQHADRHRQGAALAEVAEALLLGGVDQADLAMLQPAQSPQQSRSAQPRREAAGAVGASRQARGCAARAGAIDR